MLFYFISESIFELLVSFLNFLSDSDIFYPFLTADDLGKLVAYINSVGLWH